MMFDGAVFLDVGGHTGQTLDEVVRPKYKFRTIYVFEPMALQFQHLLRAYRNFSRVQLFDYGLSDETAAVPMYGTNERFESSIFADKKDVVKTDVSICTMVAAGNWFERNITEDDKVIMKINAEGAEIPIMNNLIDTDQIWKIHNVMLDFDCRKIPGMEHCETDLIDRFKDIGFDRYSSCDAVMIGKTHQSRIGNWLSTIK